jgi:hypothetical protein
MNLRFFGDLRRLEAGRQRQGSSTRELDLGSPDRRGDLIGRETPKEAKKAVKCAIIRTKSGLITE